MSRYDEEDFLMLSGLQHFSFCRRQWALIHIEQQWSENLRTVEGGILHERAHDSRFIEKRGDVLVTRALPVHSAELGVSGVCDIVEFQRLPCGIPLQSREGLWLPVPVEYKRGEPKQNDADRLQLCCQAMCLEEMLACEVPDGFLYYGETHRREKVEFTQALREQVREMLAEMHAYYSRSFTPKVKPSKSCNACSLKELCLPKLCGKLSARTYIKARLQEDEECENC